ncbi:MAG TPA: hypothetical protein VGJ03_07885 [Acidimicrobiales bacterium]|jgi:hypothetical protein
MSTNTLIVLSVVDIALLIAGLSFYLWVVGGQLTRVATNLEECAEIVGEIVRNAEVIEPGVEHINHTGGVIAGALPLLYGMAEGIVAGATYEPAVNDKPRVARPAAGRRRSRFHDAVGYSPAE